MLPIILVLDYGYIAELTKSVKIILRRLSSAQRLVTGKNEDSLEEKFCPLKSTTSSVLQFVQETNPAPEESKSTQNTCSSLTNTLTEKFALPRS